LTGGERFLDKVATRMRQSSFVRPEVVLSTVRDNGVLHGAIEVGLQRVRADLFGQPSATVSRGAAG
jgi:hypothetical protein